MLHFQYSDSDSPVWNNVGLGTLLSLPREWIVVQTFNMYALYMFNYGMGK